MAKRKDSEKPKRTVGRKPGYLELVVPKFEKIQELYEDGAVDKDICRLCGISHTSFYNYLNDHTEFFDFIKSCKEKRWDGLEDSLHRRARGFSVTSPVKKEKWSRNKDTGEMELVETTEEIKETYYPPDTAAIVFATTNRRNERWRRNEPEQNVAVNITISKDDDI